VRHLIHLFEECLATASLVITYDQTLTVSSTSPAVPIPPPLRGSGAKRVHNTTLSYSGYPDATPKVKGLLAFALMTLLGTLSTTANNLKGAHHSKNLGTRTSLLVIALVVLTYPIRSKEHCR
jgi:hypothetical protein